MHALHFRKTNKKFPCHWGQNCSCSALLLPSKPQPLVTRRQPHECTQCFPCSPAWPLLWHSIASWQHAVEYPKLLCRYHKSSHHAWSSLMPPLQLALLLLHLWGMSWLPSCFLPTTPSGLLSSCSQGQSVPHTHHKFPGAPRPPPSWIPHTSSSWSSLPQMVPITLCSGHLPHQPPAHVEMMTNTCSMLKSFLVHEM